MGLESGATHQHEPNLVCLTLLDLRQGNHVEFWTAEAEQLFEAFIYLLVAETLSCVVGNDMSHLMSDDSCHLAYCSAGAKVTCAHEYCSIGESCCDAFSCFFKLVSSSSKKSLSNQTYWRSNPRQRA